MGEEKQSKESRHSVAPSKKSFDGRSTSRPQESHANLQAISPATFTLWPLMMAVVLAMMALGLASHVVGVGSL